jgi:GNAT superfamily N-acetyltransferase
MSCFREELYASWMEAFQAPCLFRRATREDAEVIAHHRAWMFRDIGSVSHEEADQIFESSVPWFESLLSEEEYVGWLALCQGDVVAGGGIHLRYLGPMPGCCTGGRAGHIANVYTLSAHRRRGLAREIIKMILGWAETEQLDRVTLSASEQGRGLYESLGFVATLEMYLPIRQHLSVT